MPIIVVPSGRRYTSTLRGYVWRPVTCANCGSEFAYQLPLTASGGGYSPLWLANNNAKRQAERRAKYAYEKKARTEIGLVRCPDCHHYQPDMIQKLNLELVADVLAPVLATVAVVVPIFTQWRGDTLAFWLFVVFLFGVAPFIIMKTRRALGIFFASIVVVFLALLIGGISVFPFLGFAGLVLFVVLGVRAYKVGQTIYAPDPDEKPKYQITRRAEFEAMAAQVKAEKGIQLQIPKWD